MVDYDGSNTTGFMSPAQDYADTPVDLREYIDLAAPNTFLAKVSGGMPARDVQAGDILVLDTAATLGNGDIVLVFSGGDVVYTEAKRESGIPLIRCNGIFRHLREDEEIWAVVVALVRKVR